MTISTPLTWLSLLMLRDPGCSSNILRQLLNLPTQAPQPPHYNSLPQDPLENERKRKKRKKTPARRKSTSSMIHSPRPNNLKLLTATSLSAAHSSTWGCAAHTISAMTPILKHNSLQRTKAWVLSRKYGGIHTYTHTANTFSFTQSQ
jgi:hypothetical protein